MTTLPLIPPDIVIGLDFETTGLDYWHQDFRVLNVAIATGDREWVFDFRTTPNLAQWLGDVLRGRTVATHNAQFEYQCMRVIGCDPRLTKWWCTMVNECLIYEHYIKYDLMSVAGYHGIIMGKIAIIEKMRQAMGLQNKDEVMANMANAPPDLIAEYVASDARAALKIYHSQLVFIDKEDLHGVSKLEMDLLPVLADMSWGGVLVDLSAAYAAIPKLDVEAGKLQQEINNIAGGTFNVNSTPQVRAFFNPTPVNKYQWSLIDGTIVGPTKGGTNPSIGQDALREIKHPMAEKILALRKTIKLRDTFIRGHIIASADGDGYVHTQFNQTRNDADAGTITGRLSSTGPALQQITKRDKVNASILRAMFLPDHGHDWFCADYSQVDFRCGAHLQNDPDVLRAYQENPGLDYHQIVSDMTGIPRNPPYAGAPNTKQMNLGLAFGAGQGKLGFMMGMPYTIKEFKGKMTYVAGPEAKKVFDMYHRRLPAVKTFMKKAEMIAKDSGYVKTQIGRRLRFLNGGYHKAAGLLYQAHAADLHKQGLINVDNVIRRHGIDARLMLSVHDEIGVSMMKDEEAMGLIIKEYTDFGSDSPTIRMRVPITASGGFGSNWWESSK